MSWPEVEHLLRECAANPGADPDELATVHDVALPEDYVEFLGRMNGLEGFVRPNQYLMLWKVQEIAELNAAYAVAEFLPNVVLIGTDGGDTGFGYDSRRRQYISTPLVGIGPGEMRDLGGTFGEFVKTLASA